MSKMSRNKGKRGELEVAAIIRSHGFEARRGQQHRGGSDSPDVIHNIPGLHIETKFVEEFSINDLYDALKKAENEALERADEEVDSPIVCYRRNRKGWLIVFDLDDFLFLMEERRDLTIQAWPHLSRDKS